MDGGEDEVFDWGREWVWGGFEEEDGEGVEGSRWVCGGIGEKCGGERGFGGSEKVGETFEDGHLVDEFVDVWDVSTVERRIQEKSGWFSGRMVLGVRAGDSGGGVAAIIFSFVLQYSYFFAT